MIIVPELKKVFILVPRTGSGTLYRELMRVYPRSMLLYRHMEADGCPQGYDRWHRVGFVRHPLYRLHSLFKFMRGFNGGAQVQGGGASDDAKRILAQVQGLTFEDWLLTNDLPWTVPFDVNGNNDYWPVLACKNAAPQNRLSQYTYLRPDLGVEVRRFDNLRDSLKEWGLNANALHNQSTPELIDFQQPTRVREHLERYCAWDLNQGCVQ